MSIKERLSTGLVWVAALCAILVTISTLWPRGPLAAAAELEPRVLGMKQWTEIKEGGHLLVAASTQPSIEIVYFTDYECPYCNRFERASLRGALAEFPGRVSVRVRHWPLPSHKLAYSAARAVECAALQDVVSEYHEVLTLKADSIGIISFVEMASSTGMPDTASFRNCVTRADPVLAVDNDVAAARSLAGLGTPLIIIDGTLYPAAPDSATFVSAVRKAVSES